MKRILLRLHARGNAGETFSAKGRLGWSEGGAGFFGRDEGESGFVGCDAFRVMGESLGWGIGG